MPNGSEQWQALEEKYSILESVEKKSFALITSTEINQTQKDYPHLKFEARLLTNFGNKKQLPELFTNNGLAILPYERGSYIIGKFNIFANTPSDLDTIEVRKMPRLTNLETLQESQLANEAMGLNYALANGITQDFIGEELTASVAGRQKSGNWSYKIESEGQLLTLEARNTQIEVDGGYEGESNIVLIEAKNKLVHQFCLRQLYFPYRAWKSKSNKTIRTLFATFNYGEVFLHEFVFPEFDLFKGELIRSLRYQVSNDVITLADLRKIIQETQIEPTNVPFPQANSILRTMDIIEYLAPIDEVVSKEQIAETYGFTDRQGDYYGNAVAYLGFAEKRFRKGYISNIQAKKFVDLPSARQKHLLIIETFCKRAAIRETIIKSLEFGEVLSCSEIQSIINKHEGKIGERTQERRASSIRNWVSWMFGIIE